MKRVLIVDDDRATSAGMADVAEEWGYEPEVADTVDDESLVARLGVLDVLKPEGDEEIRAEPDPLPPHKHEQDALAHHEHEHKEVAEKL